MKTQFISAFRKMESIVWVVVFLASVTVAHATTHIIQFGGSFGYHYSPDSLNVTVGDTIQWEGDFSMHPLSSTNIPAGALSFHQGSGTVFTYYVTIAGKYLYKCDYHAAIGMIGSFTAAATTGIKNIQTSLQPGAFKLMQNYPNPFNPTTTISFDIPVQTYVTLKVYNVIGQEVAMIVSENMAAGSYSKIWNAASMPSGVYFYRLSAGTSDSRDSKSGSFTASKKLILLK